MRLVFVIFAAGFFLFRPNFHAQAPTPSPRVIVITQFIPVAETTSALPVTVYPVEVLKKLGASTPIEGLRELPSFIGRTATENDSNGGDGSANLNLLGLGAPNTLVLINGRRTFNFRDINAIPISALSRVEVLQHGAAPVFGSDAGAGVFNFILVNGPGERPYEAAELNALYGNTTENDAHVRQVYLRGGVTGLDGKFSIAAVGEYYSRANLFARDREISRTADLSNDGTGLGLGGPNNNSPTFGGRVTVAPAATGMGAPAGGALVLINLSDNQISAASYRPFDPAGTGTDPSRFNFRAFSPAIPAMEKTMYFVTGRYKFFGDVLQPEGLQLYGDIMYSKVKQDNGQAGTPFTMTAATNGRNEARASSFNPFGNNLTSIAYRTQQELGNRRSFFDKDYYRYVVGIQGDFNIKDNDFISRWGYDSGYLYERLDSERVDSGDARRSYLRALIAPNGFANAAAPLPLIPVANRGTFNPFIGVNAPVTGTAPTYVNGVPTGQTAPYDNRIAALDWTNGGASYIGHSFFYERDWLADAKFNAHLFPNLPSGGIDLAAGYERRESNQKQIDDQVQASNDQLGFNPVAPLKFREEVESWFFEIGIPFVTSNMMVPGVRALELDIAWRRDEFTDTNLLARIGTPLQTRASFGNENPDESFGGSPRVAVRYQPIPDITLRASWQQSIRPPTYAELFTPITQNFPIFFGPGIIPQPANGIFEGGNPQAKPETTESYSAGIVWEPKSVPGFTLTMDAYQLYTTNLILDPDSFAQVLLTQNIPDSDGCGLGVLPGGGPGLGVTRNAAGSVDCIDSGYANAGKRLVEALYVTALYEIPTEHWGKFTLVGGWNHFFTWKGQGGPGNPTVSFLGNYDTQTLPFAPGAIPWNKGFLRGEWERRHIDFVATVNYVGDFRDDPSFDNIVREERRNVPSYITLDMQLSYEFVKPPIEPTPYVKEAKESASVIKSAAETSSIWQRLLWGTKFTAGVNNAFDRNPPTVLGAFNDNYDTSLHSLRNRYWYVAVSKKF